MRETKEKTPEQALARLMDRCARQETCLSDARTLLFRWNVPPGEWDRIIESLLRDRFIDEERYAEAFVRDKMNFSRWGAGKIREALYRKRIPASVIERAMEQLESDKMEEKLRTDLERKSRALREENPYKRKEKLIRFGLSRGYEMDRVLGIVEEITKDFL